MIKKKSKIIFSNRVKKPITIVKNNKIKLDLVLNLSYIKRMKKKNKVIVTDKVFVSALLLQSICNGNKAKTKDEKRADLTSPKYRYASMKIKKIEIVPNIKEIVTGTKKLIPKIEKNNEIRKGTKGGLKKFEQ